MYTVMCTYTYECVHRCSAAIHSFAYVYACKCTAMHVRMHRNLVVCVLQDMSTSMCVAHVCVSPQEHMCIRCMYLHALSLSCLLGRYVYIYA